MGTKTTTFCSYRLHCGRKFGQDHIKSFVVDVHISSDPYRATYGMGQGTGKKKKAAEQDAAQYLMLLLGVESIND
jgi:dsRNA-specific ribonuclease